MRTFTCTQRMAVAHPQIRAFSPPPSPPPHPPPSCVIFFFDVKARRRSRVQVSCTEVKYPNDTRVTEGRSSLPRLLFIITRRLRDYCNVLLKTLTRIECYENAFEAQVYKDGMRCMCVRLSICMHTMCVQMSIRMLAYTPVYVYACMYV